MQDDIGLTIEDSLNLHVQQIYLLRKTGNVDILYPRGHPSISFEKADW